ncbi:MAG: TldD/PmbA family protein [Lachnospiraceae bacterium]|nr:TldD/PmbA family protein [Lachnospiraceae bacterium]
MIRDIFKGRDLGFETGVQSVLRGQENRARSVVIHQGVLVTNQRSEERGVCAKVYKEGMNGFASMAEFSEAAALQVVREATQNANYLYKYAKKTKPALGGIEKTYIESPYTIIDFEQKRIIDLCKELDSYIAKKYSDLASRTVVYREDTMEKVIYTSDAGNGYVAYPRVTVYIMMKAETPDGNVVDHFDSFGGKESLEDHFTNLEKVYEGIDEVYKKLKEKANGVYAEAGVKTVILHPDVAGMIAHEAIGHTVEADLVLGGSVAGPNLGKQVASELISIVDYANTYNGAEAPLPVFMDDEGVAAKDAVLLENGILKGYMHSRESAAHFGVEPCGNARGWAFSDEPLIRMRNTLVLPGKDKLEDMIASVDDGYYLLATGNGQADLTGEFMFGVTCGYEIKSGKLGRAILDTTVSGVAFDMLKTVDMISDTVKWSPSGTCGKKQPMAVSMGGPAIKCRINIGGR